MFWGYLRFLDTVETPLEINPLAQESAPSVPSDRVGHWQSGRAALTEHRRFNGCGSRDECVPLVCPNTGAAVAFWGRLDNRDELLQELRQEHPAADTTSDAQLVLAAWRRWDEAVPERLLGDFVLAVADPRRDQLLLARDPLGVKPLYYTRQSAGLIFATSVAMLRQVQGLTLTPDPDWMARYLLNLSRSDRHTGYREIVKLPPGHCLTVAADGREHVRQWHHWRDDPPPARRRDQRWLDAYRAVLKEAIRCRMTSDFPLGTENSGGLDSASVTAYLANLLGEPGEHLHSFGFALSEQESDYILATSQARQITHNHIISSRVGLNDSDTRIDQGLRVLGYPEEHNNGSGHIPFYRECQLHGIRTLFSGFGGDEVVTYSGRLLRQELLDQGEYGGLWDILPGNGFSKTLRMGKAFVAGRRNPAFNPRWLADWNARWPHHLLRADVVQRLNLHADYMEGARHDAPYRRINDFVLSLLRKPYVATRLENCTLMAAAFGVEYRWPLLDTRLVQQYLSTPSIEKVGPDGIGRYLHRRAIDGVVPRRVAWKPGKDMGYENHLRKARIRWVAQAAEDARALDADLHPLLDQLIDRSKLRETIKLAESGLATPEFTFSCRIGVGGLKWLDRWLRMA